jgi:hypothetical protein
MKEKFNGFLKHPIWSNVIAAFIVLGLTISYNFVLSKFRNTNFITEFLNFWNYKIQLWFILLFVFTAYLVFKILSKPSPRNINYKYDNKTLKLDRNLFEKIRTEIIDENVVINLKGNSFSSYPFDINDIDFVHNILEQDKNPNFEFINTDLELLKEDLIKAIDKLHDSLNNNIFGTNIRHPTKNFIGIPKEWKGEKLQIARNEIENDENIIFDKYEKLIKTGRRILKI